MDKLIDDGKAMNQTDIQEDSKPLYNLLQSLSLALV
jgi:hypothetical protein